MENDRFNKVRKEISKIQKQINVVNKKVIECSEYKKTLKSQLRDIEQKCQANPGIMHFYLVELNRIKIALQTNTEYNRMYAEQMTYLKMAKKANDRLVLLLKNVQ